MKLFVWEDFKPDYTSGLAFAIAETQSEAEQIIASKSFHEDGTPIGMDLWGECQEFPLGKIGFFVRGGS